ncbi:4a-hydroxytetrahydrobiopterin dehydratase [Paenalkalicoccus suaedae]|uniref:4a-hydroxytetrahydrobiopterin dehydratase n=1 Tax=Paenalkalicoccus suaedae TaxID=2592382 RepID=A0A859FG61_9BACI|nr:4a-hydroxytetrahydrobiopterin dehydratase [Paenalkalicoccus suaedae]QKS71808.1 4a-hydroxytetrahydrobiopterin dehydratase [Paenalkalicoccus suaedae]
MVLSQEEINENLEDSKGWEQEDQKIVKSYTLSSFPKALQFVQALGNVAEDRQHHPHMTIDHRKVTIKLTTNDEGGLTQKDFESADAYDKLVKKYE